MHFTYWNDFFYIYSRSKDASIELKKGNGSFKSAWKDMTTGTYNAQLVIEEEIFPVVEFEVDEQTE